METIVKKLRGPHPANFDHDAYVTFKGSMCSFNRKVRDHILPNRYVSVKKLDNGNILFSGTNNEDDFKMTIYKKTGQASISRGSIDHYILRDGKYRIPCILLPDHVVLLNIGQLVEY